MKTLLGIVLAVLVLVGIYFIYDNYQKSAMEPSDAVPQATSGTPAVNTRPVEVAPISHATMVLTWGDTVIYTDPVGGAEAFLGKPPADLVLVTDIHGDHLSTSTLSSVVASGTALIVPQAVKDLLPAALAGKAQVLPNGERMTARGLEILAMPMYNLPETSESRHVKGRGNGYVLSRDGYRVYVAGDTAGIPEMRSLNDIDMAFVPMNLPFTMSVEEAADAVLDFKPKEVYPYHYRGQSGLSDVSKFKELVNAGDPDIDVVLLDWYPAAP